MTNSAVCRLALSGLVIAFSAITQADCEPIYKGSLVLVNPFQVQITELDNAIFKFEVLKNATVVVYQAPAHIRPFLGTMYIPGIVEEAKAAGKMLFLDSAKLIDNFGLAGEDISVICK